ncbi:hypothetical protein BDD12DRAFT_866444 [Trichophaea hybrida]|nr:hypothetical protein BDD12DRAFT_866444 [Trichophaea hybrida]
MLRFITSSIDPPRRYRSTAPRLMDSFQSHLSQHSSTIDTNERSPVQHITPAAAPYSLHSVITPQRLFLVCQYLQRRQRNKAGVGHQ